MGRYEEVEAILREYKYVAVKVEEIKQNIFDIKINTPGALKAICTDSIKISPTHSISNVIENRVMKKEEIIDELEIKIYMLQRNNRIIDKTLAAMGQPYEKLFYYKYVEELSTEEISSILKVSTRQISRLQRRLIDRLKDMLE